MAALGAWGLALLLALGAVRGQDTPAPERGGAASTQGAIDLVLIVDVSASMRGEGGGQDIFADVQRAAKELVGELGVGDSVTLIPFADRARLQPTVTLHSETERQRVYGLIDQLVADGRYTFTAEAVRAGLEEAARLEALFPHRAKVVVILTDGINNPPPEARGRGPSLAEVAQPYAGRPWFVYQVQLSPALDRELEAAIRTFRGGVIHDPRGAQLRELAERVLANLPQTVRWAAEPQKLALLLREVAVPAEARLRLAGLGDLPLAAIQPQLRWDREPAGVNVELALSGGPPGEATLLLRTSTAARLPDGSYQGTLVVALGGDTKGFTAEPLAVPVALQVALVPARWPYVLAALAGLLAVALGALGVRRARRRRLFGSLEAWPQGRAQHRVTFADLSQFGAKAALGPRSLQLPGVDSPLAVLRTHVIDGRRHVMVHPDAQQRLRFRGREEAELVLYDGDEFELGGWCFRYRGEVPRRRH